MLLLLCFLLFLVTSFLVLLMPALWGREIYKRYSGSRAVICPSNGRQVAVRFDALHAATTGFSGQPNLRLADCTYWPERMDCGQECIAQASTAKQYTEGEVAPPKMKAIRHLPVVSAAFGAWVLGAIWHSQYVFRSRWTEAVGMGGIPSRQVAGSWAPHLLSVGMCLLFAYGVAWLLARTGKRGVGAGIITSVFLWGTVALASVAGTGIQNISSDLLRIELLYTFLASVIVGVIEGALAGRKSPAADALRIGNA